MEASALTGTARGGLLTRRSPLIRFEPDERLVKLIRAGHDGAFEALFNRYHSRLLAFCTSMLKSRQDAEDVLQEVFANAHAAMLNDDRPINVRPWLYRIARNRCLNHLRKPVPEGQDSMDIHPHQNGTTTAEEVQHREDLREVLNDVRTLPETQRTALLLREIDQLSYEEIAVAMDTTVPSIKSLLVRARIGLAESSKARMLTCGEVQVELAEAAEGVAKASGPARKHVRSCEGCREFRNQLRADRKALAALFPFGPIALIKGGLLAKLFGGSGAAGSSGAAASGGAAGAGAAATGGAGAVGAAGAAGAVGAAGAAGGAASAGGFSGGMGILGSALGAKAAAGVATAALITAGAVEVRNLGDRGAETQVPRDNVPVLTDNHSGDRHARHSSLPQFTPATSADVNAGGRVLAEDPVETAPASEEGQQADASGPTDDGTTATDPTTPEDGAEIGGVGEVPTAEDPSEDQNTGSTPDVPEVPTTPAPTDPPTSTTPTTPPPAELPPPVVVDPAPVTPAPPTTPPVTTPDPVPAT